MSHDVPVAFKMIWYPSTVALSAAQQSPGREPWDKDDLMISPERATQCRFAYRDILISNFAAFVVSPFLGFRFGHPNPGFWLLRAFNANPSGCRVFLRAILGFETAPKAYSGSRLLALDSYLYIRINTCYLSLRSAPGLRFTTIVRRRAPWPGHSDESHFSCTRSGRFRSHSIVSDR
jgi:hypothetical protein